MAGDQEFFIGAGTGDWKIFVNVRNSCVKKQWYNEGMPRKNGI